MAMCSLFCPMLNKYGYCESAMRRVEQVRECPHKRMKRTVSNSDTVETEEEVRRCLTPTRRRLSVTLSSA